MIGPSPDTRRPTGGLKVLVGLWVALAWHCAFPRNCQAQAPSDIIYTRQSLIRLPMVFDKGKDNIREIHLYVSTDQGRSWLRSGSAVPEARGFEFQAPRDGQYWFTLQTIDRENRAEPPSMQGAKPQLKVYVDTQPPAVFVRPGAAREGQITVQWEIHDDTLDLRTLRLDYRPPGGTAWFPLQADPTLTGQRSYNVGAVHGPIEIRLSINDRGGNPREATTTINPSGGDNRFPNPADANRGAAPPGSANARLVNSKRISLNYSIEGEGKSGIKVIELWYTRDGFNWQKGREHPTKQPPFEFDVEGEGLYGFTLVVLSGVGLGDRAPQRGDPPQVWVEVDLTKPMVQLQGVVVGQGADVGKATVTWRATDKNLRQQPITISYAEKKEGPWTPAATNLDNTGRYVWLLKDELPHKFFVRVEAADLAGNIGSAETEQQVVVDLAQPKGKILGVEPVGKQ